MPSSGSPLVGGGELTPPLARAPAVEEYSFCRWGCADGENKRSTERIMNAIVFTDTKTIALTIRSLDRCISLQHNKFQSISTRESNLPYPDCFANTTQPNQRATIASLPALPWEWVESNSQYRIDSDSLRMFPLTGIFLRVDYWINR